MVLLGGEGPAAPRERPSVFVLCRLAAFPGGRRGLQSGWQLAGTPSHRTGTKDPAVPSSGSCFLHMPGRAPEPQQDLCTCPVPSNFGPRRALCLPVALGEALLGHVPPSTLPSCLSSGQGQLCPGSALPCMLPSGGGGRNGDGWIVPRSCVSWRLLHIPNLLLQPAPAEWILLFGC